MEQTPRTARYRFGAFTLDLAAWQLRRGTRIVKLERRPMDLLVLLVERRGRLISRAEIADRLWGADVFVDVETGVNTAVRKVRVALGDSSDVPTFVETVPGKGYRFIAEVTDERATDAAPAVAQARGQPPDTVPTGGAEHLSNRPRVKWWWGGGVAVLVAALALGAPGIWWRHDAPDTTSLTLAVLPFDNIGTDPDRDYLAAGLTEETIHSLAQIDPTRVRVIGRTSARAYQGTSKTLAEIGRELGVDYLVEGSVRAEHDRVRVATRLIRASDQVQVWADVYDRTPASLLGLQDELSAAIAAQGRRRLSPERLAAVTRRLPARAEAYDLYLRGLFHHSQLTATSVPRGLGYYRQATEADPTYTLAWAGIATALTSRLMNSDLRHADIQAQAREAASRAVATGPDLSDAQRALGYVAFIVDWDWPVAERALTRATELDPSSAMAHLMLGHTLSQMRRHDEARRHMARARQLDPLYALTHALSSQVEFQARDFDAAVRHARAATTLDPEFWIGYMQLGQALLATGHTDDAIAAFTRSSRFSAGNSKPLSHRGYALAAAGQPDEARQVLETLRVLSADRYVPPYAMALVAAGLGEADEAFRWLDEAYAVHDAHLIFLTVDPKWDPLRADARFTALLARCGF